MNILWLTWKDIKNPAAGGAEVITDHLASALAKKKHNVLVLTSGFQNCVREEVMNGYKVIRVGNRYSVYVFAIVYYLQNLKKWPDRVVEEINTIPFFSQFYTGVRPFIYIFQLAGAVWFHEIFFPLSIIGFLLEPLYLKAFIGFPVITESMSTKDDLLKLGFIENNIHIVPIALTIDAVGSIKQVLKYPDFTLLSFGAIRSMKQTHFQVRAFEIAKKKIPHLKLVLAGKPVGSFGKRVLKMVKNSQFASDIQYLGEVDSEQKIQLFQKCHLLLMSSIKEGWGLVVTEAASQGTPSIVFNSTGLKDSVRHNSTGIICSENSAENMADQIVDLFGNQGKYKRLQLNAWKFSKTFTKEASISEFFKVVL